MSDVVVPEKRDVVPGRRHPGVKGSDADSSSARSRQASSAEAMAGKIPTYTEMRGMKGPMSDRHTSAVNALLSMLAMDDKTATAILLHVMEKKAILEAKELPKCPLYLAGERLKELQALQMKQYVLNKEMLLKCDEVEKDYQEKAKPLYQRRNEIVAGIAENGKGVPGFWLSALLASPVSSKMITYRDVDALKYLTDIHCATIDGGKSAKLEFVFDGSNPFFKNTVLTRAVDFKRRVGKYVIVKARGTQIDWEEGKCLTQTYSELTTKMVECKSFFGLFKSSDEFPGDKRWMIAFHNAVTEEIMDTVIPHAVSLCKKARHI